MRRSVRFLALCAGLVVGSVAHAKDLGSYDVNAAAPQASPRQATIAEAARAGGSITAFDERRGAPSFLWATRKHSAPGAAVMPEMAARHYLDKFARTYGLSPAAVGTAEVVSVHDLGRGAVIVKLRQRIDGVEVYRNDVKVMLKQNLDLVAISGSLHPAATPQGKPGTRTFKISSGDALARAFEKLYGVALSPSALKDAGRSEGGYERFDLAPTPAVQAAGLGFTEPARVKRVFFPVGDKLVPAYFVEIYAGKTSEPEADYVRYVMSARDGQMLYRENLTAYDSFNYRVWADTTDGRPFDGPQEDYTPHPNGTPDGTEPAYVAPNLVSMEGFNENPNGLVDPWLAASAVQTLGNNVDAYVDHAAPDGYSNGDMRATTTAAKTFDWTYDTAQGPTASASQSMAATTQLFYVNNWLHDYYYNSGFDEAGGNAQANNFGRGGVGGDVLKAEAQDGAFSGNRNNANMNTPADGVSPRMQMYLWSSNDIERTLSVQPLGTTPPSGVAGFGPTTFTVTGDLVLADDGVVGSGTTPGTVNDGCEAPWVNAADVAGKIVLVERGFCSFKLKAVNAQAAGAIGVIIANHAAGGDAPMTMGNGDPTAAVVTIPALSVGFGEGNALKAAIAAGTTTVTLHRIPGLERDGTIDNNIVSHEWGHYFHHRLSDCGTSQCSAMSEGWGDFMALHVSVREGEDLDGVYAMAGYSTKVLGDSAYYGIRRLPYTTDMTRNPLTFQHIQNGVALPQIPMQSGGATNAEVHNAGEIWTSMLFEGYVSLLKRSQEPNAPYSFEDARRLMADYIIAGLKMSPVDGTITEVRDSILAAAFAQNPDDATLLAEGFAKRGAGSCAESPDRYSSDFVGVIEGFELQPKIAIASAKIDDSMKSCDMDGVLDGDEAGRVTIEVHNPSSAPLVDAELRVATTLAGVTFPGGDTVTLPVVPAFGSITAELDVELDESFTQMGTLPIDVTVENAEACVTSQLLAIVPRINFDDVLNASASDDVESEKPAWTRAGKLGEDIWARTAVDADNHVWHGLDLSSTSDTWLESPDLVVSATDEFMIHFEHAYDFEASTAADGSITYWDGGVIEISEDGGASWSDISVYADPGYSATLVDGVNVLANRMAYGGQNPSYPAVDMMMLDLGTALGGKTVRVRFRIGTDSAAGALGWTIDNLSFMGITNTPFSVVQADEGLCQLLPVANAGADQTVHSGDAVTLDASASTDPNNDALTFEWSQSAGPQPGTWATAGAKAIFVAPEVPDATTLVFDVQVSDGQGATSDTMTVTVLPRTDGGEGGAGGGTGTGTGTGGGGEGGAGPGNDPYTPSGDGCGCAVVGDGASSTSNAASLGALAALGVIVARRRRRSQA